MRNRAWDWRDVWCTAFLYERRCRSRLLLIWLRTARIFHRKIGRWKRPGRFGGNRRSSLFHPCWQRYRLCRNSRSRIWCIRKLAWEVSWFPTQKWSFFRWTLFSAGFHLRRTLCYVRLGKNPCAAYLNKKIPHLWAENMCLCSTNLKLIVAPMSWIFDKRSSEGSVLSLIGNVRSKKWII